MSVATPPITRTKPEKPYTDFPLTPQEICGQISSTDSEFRIHRSDESIPHRVVSRI